MTAPIVFLDTETTSLGPDRLPWEIALIRYDEGISYLPALEGPPAKFASIRLFIDDVDLSDADAFALKIGGFYDRHPRANGSVAEFDAPSHPFVGGHPKHTPEHTDLRREYELYSEREAMVLVEQWTRGATIVGANPAFDTEVLGNRFRWNDLCPSWHHRLVDVESLTAGHFGALNDAGNLDGLDTCTRLLGVDVDESVAHTAMGDALLAKAVFEKVMHGPWSE